MPVTRHHPLRQEVSLRQKLKEFPNQLQQTFAKFDEVDQSGSSEIDKTSSTKRQSITLHRSGLSFQTFGAKWQ